MSSTIIHVNFTGFFYSIFKFFARSSNQYTKNLVDRNAFQLDEACVMCCDSFVAWNINLKNFNLSCKPFLFFFYFFSVINCFFLCLRRLSNMNHKSTSTLCFPSMCMCGFELLVYTINHYKLTPIKQ